MRESDLLTWLVRTSERKRALVLGGGLALVVLFLGIPGAVLASVYVGVPTQFTSLLISAFGALSTVLLVGVTFATFVENQMRMEKEHQRALVREELREVLQPTTTRLESNCSTLNGSTVRWYRFDSEQWQNSNLFGFELERLRDRGDDDIVIFKRFFDNEPAIAVEFDEHDEQVKQLATKGSALVETLTEPLAKYIRNNDIRDESGEYPDAQWIAVYVVSGVNKLPHENHDRKLWAEYKEEFQEVAEDVAPDELAEFRRMKQEYLEFAESLQTELQQTRGELQREYSISLNNHVTNSESEYRIV